MQVRMISSNTSNRNQSQSFKAAWKCRFCDTLWRAGLDNYNAGNGKRFFNALKNLSKISEDAVLTMEKHRKDPFDTYEYLTVTNLTNDHSVVKRLYTSTQNYFKNYNNEQSLEITQFLEELSTKTSIFREALFGKKPGTVPPATQGKRYIEAKNDFDYVNQNILPHFISDYRA